VRLLGVHPGPLMYKKVFLRLEPLGLELVAQSLRRAGHQVRLIDLQVEDHRAYFRLLRSWRSTAGISTGASSGTPQGRRPAAAAGANQLRQELVQSQQRLSAGIAARRPCRPVAYEIPLPPQAAGEPQRRSSALYIHALRGRKGRAIDAATERFVEQTRMGAAP